ncbi:hypothetical protein K8Q93_01025 [Candidatus Parcubacteria bacterium]|nr:hypothetical protein [Candidatus Parcubacteria bacterium]
MSSDSKKQLFLFLAYFVGTVILIVVAFFGWRYITNTDTSVLTGGPNGNSNLPIFPSVGGGASLPSGSTNGNGEKKEEVPETPKVYQVSAKPVAGYTIAKNNGEWVTRYVDRGTGNIYESSLEKVSHKRITNTTLPQTVEATFTSSSTVLLRSTLPSGAIRTQYGRVLATSSGEFRPLLTSELPEDITWLSARSNDIFYLQKDDANGTAGFLMNLDRKVPSRIFSYPLSEWIPRLLEGNRVFLQSKASAYAPGGLFLLSGNATNPAPLLLGGYGLAALPNDKGTKALVSQTVTNFPQLSLLDIATKRTSSLPLSTFAEKCTWSTASSSIAYCFMPKTAEPGVYPDEWYSGEKSFTDTLWEVNTATGDLVILEKFTEEEMDSIEVSVSGDNRFLLFINKKDLSLWSVRLR